MEPFQTRLLNPNRRAPLFSGKKVNRSADTQSDASGLGMIGNLVRENFLLRHSYCEKNQGSLCLDNEIDTLPDLALRFYEPHRGRVNHNIEARVPVLQSSASRARRTDDRYCEALLRGTCDEIGCKITTCNDGNRKTADPGQAAQNAAIAKHAPRPLVERSHGSRILKQSYYMVYIWCYHVPKASVRLSENVASSFFD